jgi:hypothetical protein
MKVLFIGNSFTFYNDLPMLLQEMGEGKCECDSITRGAAYLKYYQNPEDELRKKFDDIYPANEWDYVILQEQSSWPSRDRANHLESVAYMKELIDHSKIMIYATWSYKQGSEKLADSGFGYDEMYEKQTEAALAATEMVDGIYVPAGTAFRIAEERYPEMNMYHPDCYHPSPRGSYLVACLFSYKLFGECTSVVPSTLNIPAEDAQKLRDLAAELCK